MKFVIEITSGPTSSDECLSRTIVAGTHIDTIKAKAALLVEIWTPYGATGARILSQDGHTVIELPRTGAQSTQRAA
jgi:hypothetical protein